MKEALTEKGQNGGMADDETISDLPLKERASRYKLLAEDASKLADEATGHARQVYAVLAEKSRTRGEESEAALRRESEAGDASDTTSELPLPALGRRKGRRSRRSAVSSCERHKRSRT
jgi:hypothetical protein